jgi:hypothetical protein
MNKTEIEIPEVFISWAEDNSEEPPVGMPDNFYSWFIATQVRMAEKVYRHLKSLHDQTQETGLRGGLDLLLDKIMSWHKLSRTEYGNGYLEGLEESYKLLTSSPSDKPEGEKKLPDCVCSMSYEGTQYCIFPNCDRYADTSAQPPADPLGEADEAFDLLSNVNQGLRDQICYLEEQLLNNSGACRWVRALDRLPKLGKILPIKITGWPVTLTIGHFTIAGDFWDDYNGNAYPADQIEWLDESQDLPSSPSTVTK